MSSQDLYFPLLLPSFEMKTPAPHIRPLHRATLGPGAMGNGLWHRFVPFFLACVSFLLGVQLSGDSYLLDLSLVPSVLPMNLRGPASEVRSDTRELAVWVSSLLTNCLFAYICALTCKHRTPGVFAVPDLHSCLASLSYLTS